MRGRGEESTEFVRLYDTHFDGIFRYLLLRTGNVAEAEDLTAQTFFKALRGFSRLRWFRRSASAWLYRIATNELNSHIRRSRRRARWETGVADVGGAAVRERETAEQRLEREQLFRQLAGALRTLKPDEQALVALRYFERRSYSEIALILRRREGTLAMRTHRALGKLRAELEKRGVDHEGVREGFAEGTTPGSSGRRVQAGAAP